MMEISWWLNMLTKKDLKTSGSGHFSAPSTPQTSSHWKEVLNNGIWIRCVFEALNHRPNQVVGLPGESDFLEHTLNNSSLQKALSSISKSQPFERPSFNYGHGIDIKFIQEDLQEGTVIKILQCKLFRVEDYYKTAVDSSSTRVCQENDNTRVLEIDTMSFKFNFLKRGGNTILSDYSSTNFKRHA